MSTALAWCLIAFSTTGDPDDVTRPIVWPDPTIRLRLHPDGSDDVPGDADLVAIRSAIAAWNAPPCTALELVDDGLDSDKTNADDGTNRIFFVENNWPGAFSGAAAVTISREQDGAPDTWRDADILLNGVDTTWSTTGEVQAHDIQSAVTHELGHLIGLKHAAHPQATMYFLSPKGITQRRTLHPADAAAVCWLYPAAARTCTNDQECPMMIASTGGGRARFACSNGQCTLGQVGYGEECFRGDQCQSNNCVDDPDTNGSDDPGFCGEPCSGSCANGDLCAAGTCFLGRADCVIDADCAGNNNVCAVDLDGRRRCQHLCLEDRHCTSGQVCHGGTGENPPGFCRTPGAGGDGAPCDDGFACASLACAGTGLTTSCLGGSATTDAGLDSDSAVSDATTPTPRDASTVGNDANLPSEPDAGAGDPPAVSGGACGCNTSTSDNIPSLFFGLIVLFLSRARVERSMRARR